jgi:hypothetical protein
VTIRCTGDWRKAQALLTRGARELGRSVDRALTQEAHALRTALVEGLDKQAPAGQALPPLAPLTIAARQLRRFRGTKVLIRTAELRNALAVIRRASLVFVGIPGTARGRDGHSLSARAEAHEYGAGPTIVPITPRMRRFLFALYRQAGRESVQTGGSGAGVVVIQIPPRPFMRPVLAAFQVGATRRFLARVAGDLTGGM